MLTFSSGIAVVCMLLMLSWQSCAEHEQQQDQPASCLAALAKTVNVYVATQRNKHGVWMTTVQLHISPGGVNNNNISVGLENELTGITSTANLTLNMTHDTGGCKGITLSKMELDIIEPAHEGYTYYEGIGFYKFHTKPTLWGDAKLVCEQEGGHLAILNSEQERDAVWGMFKEHPNVTGVFNTDISYIGFHDKDVEGQFFTIFGEPLESTGFLIWSTRWRTPDNFLGDDVNPGEDCGSIFLTDGGLNDASCEELGSFICEKELPTRRSKTLCIPN